MNHPRVIVGEFDEESVQGLAAVYPILDRTFREHVSLADLAPGSIAVEELARAERPGIAPLRSPDAVDRPSTPGGANYSSAPSS